MLLTKDQIKSAAMELDPVEREALAEELLLSITSGQRESIDAVWLAEVRRRDAMFSHGNITGRPVDEVIARLRAKGCA